MKSVLYTAVTGGYDVLPAPPAVAAGIRRVAFLEERLQAGAWEYREAHRAFDDPHRNAGIHKALAHRYFPGTECSLWMDGDVVLNPTLDLGVFLHKFMRSGDDILAFPHPTRVCLYAEAASCVERGLDDPALIERQVARYRAEGYPENAGLTESPILVRRHNNRVKRFNEIWWEEIAGGSRRDQISFDYAALRAGVTVRLLPAWSRCRTFSKVPHDAPRPRWERPE